MADDEKPRKKRRGWLWLVAGLLVLVSLTVGISLFASNREDAYLTRFHPYTEPWSSPFSTAARRDFKGTLYIFQKEDAESVAKSIGRELTPAKGYRKQVSSAPDGTTFAYNWKLGKDEYSTVYMKSKTVIDFLLSEKSRQKVPAGGCVVIVLRPPTWLERQVDAVKKFLHWE